MNLLLTVRQIATVRGSRTIFQDVSFSIASGERLAIVGESGSGKTTLLRLVAGLDEPSAGVILRAQSLRIGMVFQDLALWPNLTALDNVALALPHLRRRERREIALAALESCRVAEFAKRKPGTLSIGQQQRVALARSIAASPQLLLLDEPFTSLDLPLKLELLSEVVRLAEAHAMAVIHVTHDLHEARSLCASGLVLEDGQVLAHGEWGELDVVENCRLLAAWHSAEALGR